MDSLCTCLSSYFCNLASMPVLNVKHTLQCLFQICSLYSMIVIVFRFYMFTLLHVSQLCFSPNQILIEVDHLQAAPCPFLQIKGTNKEVVSAAAFILSLDGTYTTKVHLDFIFIDTYLCLTSLSVKSKNTFFTLQSYLQIIFESLPAFGKNSNGIHNQQAARLQELVEFIQAQVSYNPTFMNNSCFIYLSNQCQWCKY